MLEADMLTRIDESILAQAFPATLAPAAMIASDAVARLLDSIQWTDRFAVQVEGQMVLIPYRLRFASDRLPLIPTDPAWPIARALQTRNSDGFERQRALRDLLPDVRSWTAAYVVTLIGEYVVEIIEDIDAALTVEGERVLAAFLIDNPIFWRTIKQRVGSYWNAYYRHRYASEHRFAYSKAGYPGFKLIERLERARHLASSAPLPKS